MVDFFFIGAFATNSFARSRIFRCRLPRDILSKEQKTTKKGGGDVVVQPPSPSRPIPMGGGVKPVGNIKAMHERERKNVGPRCIITMVII